MTPYNMSRKPAKQYFFLMPLVWLGSWIMTRQFKLKIDKSQMKKVKPPFLVIATHQGFSDYYIGPLAVFPHRAMYVSDMEGFAAFGNWLYRGLGCIPKRRFVSDVSVVKNIRYGLLKKQSVFIYPEARHSNVGTTAYIPKNIAKFAKAMNHPVVILSTNGSYLANPFWDEEHTRKIKITAKMECICSKEELETISTEDLQKTIEEKLKYDEYRYQQTKGYLIKEKFRANGLHNALYQCKNCKSLYDMDSAGTKLFCNKCNSSWELSEDGWLIDNYNDKTHIPDWYEWQRSEAIKSIEKLPLEFEVKIEALPNEFGFVDLGKGKLVFTKNEFVLSFENSELHFPHKTRESVQTEYNYRGKGKCLVLSTRDCCYYVYSKNKNFSPTEIQFIGEYLFR